jgi:hypothetical protein
MTKKKIIPKKKTLKTKKVKKQSVLEKKETDKIYNKTKTLDILSNIKPGLALKDVVEGMKNFYFDGNSVITYNDKISILHPFKTDFQTFINADVFYKLVAKLPTDTFKMKKSKDKILFKAKGLNVNLPSIIDSEIVQRIKLVKKGIKKVEWKKLPDNFSDSISLCSFAASQTEVDSTLSCVNIDDKICVASDGKRIAYAHLDSKMDSMFIKASEVKHLTEINPTHYGISKGWLYFKNEQKCIFSMRKIEGNFPNWKHFFEFEGSKVDLPEKLLQGVDLASILTDKGTHHLSIFIENNKCILTVKTETGKLIYKADIEYDNEPIDFVINPDFLKEMMKFSTSIVFTEGRAKLETESFAVLTALYSKEEDDEGERYTRHKKK